MLREFMMVPLLVKISDSTVDWEATFGKEGY